MEMARGRRWPGRRAADVTVVVGEMKWGGSGRNKEMVVCVCCSAGEEKREKEIEKERDQPR